MALLRSSDGAILGEAVVGQTEVHAQWGGVVPTLAMEAHKRAMDAAVDEVMRQAGLPTQRIGACAATVGPGLSMCLQVGPANDSAHVTAAMDQMHVLSWHVSALLEPPAAVASAEPHATLHVLAVLYSRHTRRSAALLLHLRFHTLLRGSFP